MNAQFKKGVLEMCVLMLLNKRDTYGYELADKISKTIEIAQGTVYPLLRKLKADGYCDTYLSDASGGPPRKYYTITEKGRLEEQALKAEWCSFVGQVAQLMEDN